MDLGRDNFIIVCKFAYTLRRGTPANVYTSQLPKSHLPIKVNDIGKTFEFQNQLPIDF